MKKFCFILILALLMGAFGACASAEDPVQVAATTLPVYDFTSRLCQGTDITVGRVVTENVSCLHDYSLQTGQMRMVESAQLIVINGSGLEDFLELESDAPVIDASAGITLLCPEEEHDHHNHGHDHHHEEDPHIWLSPENARIMAANICDGLCAAYPEQAGTIRENLDKLTTDLDILQKYGEETLSGLACRELITFHDGFSYLAQAFDLSIIKAIEEESGSEASAKELIELVGIVQVHDLPAIFTETNGSISAADIIAAETGVPVFALDMAMGSESYFEAMYHNIDTLKEALG